MAQPPPPPHPILTQIQRPPPFLSFTLPSFFVAGWGFAYNSLQGVGRWTNSNNWKKVLCLFLMYNVYNVLCIQYLPGKLVVERWDEEVEGPANDDVIVEGDEEGDQDRTEPQAWHHGRAQGDQNKGLHCIIWTGISCIRGVRGLGVWRLGKFDPYSPPHRKWRKPCISTFKRTQQNKHLPEMVLFFALRMGFSTPCTCIPPPWLKLSFVYPRKLMQILGQISEEGHKWRLILYQ